MNNKILVTTDFSRNSRSAIRFAIQWQSKTESQLLFMHNMALLQPTQWSQIQYDAWVDGNHSKSEEQMEKTISGIYKELGITMKNFKFVITNFSNTKEAIIETSKKMRVNQICLSTCGAGGIMKIFGTNTSYVIKNSAIPVLAVPSRWKSRALDSALYLTDLKEFEYEIKQINSLTFFNNENLNVLHVAYSDISKQVERIKKRNIKIDSVKADLSLTLIENINRYLKRRKHSIMLMFTNTKRNFFEELLFPSNAISFSFQTKLPMMIVNKRVKK